MTARNKASLSQSCIPAEPPSPLAGEGSRHRRPVGEGDDVAAGSEFSERPSPSPDRRRAGPALSRQGRGQTERMANAAVAP
jgi:hypothetical protein